MNPFLAEKKFFLLLLYTLKAILFSSPCDILQKYLNFSKSNLLDKGSIPENNRTIAGDVDFGHPSKYLIAFI